MQWHRAVQGIMKSWMRDTETFLEEVLPSWVPAAHNEWTYQGPPLTFLHSIPITISPWNRSLQPLTFLHFPSRLFLSAHPHPHILLSLNIHSSFLYQAVSKPDCIIFSKKQGSLKKIDPNSSYSSLWKWFQDISNFFFHGIWQNSNTQ